jgi:hypothetical protein
LSKSRLSPDEYVMEKMLRPEKIQGEYMTAQASYAPFQCIDICTGELFAPTKDQCQVCLNLLSSESKSFHVDGTAGPILAYRFLFASP